MSDLSPAALALILEYEVGGGEAYYNKRLSRPNWPGFQSGVTVGIGYDLGYTARARFLADWHMIDDAHRDRLATAIGIRGIGAKDVIHRYRDIVISWHDALRVFETRTVPFWTKQTLRAFPQAASLPADAFGALVSLVFNRGPALQGRHREDMQDIGDILRDGVQDGDLALIARQLREMKSIWRGRGLAGLVARREAEAKLVEAAT